MQKQNKQKQKGSSKRIIQIRPQEFWEGVIKEKTREGLSWKEAAKRHEVSCSTLYDWSKKLSARNPEQAKEKSQVNFVEVDVLNVLRPSDFQTGNYFTANFPNRLSLSIPIDAPVKSVVAIVNGLLEKASDKS